MTGHGRPTHPFLIRTSYDVLLDPSHGLDSPPNHPSPIPPNMSMNILRSSGQFSKTLIQCFFYFRHFQSNSRRLAADPVSFIYFSQSYRSDRPNIRNFFFFINFIERFCALKNTIAAELVSKLWNLRLCVMRVVPTPLNVNASFSCTKTRAGWFSGHWGSLSAVLSWFEYRFCKILIENWVLASLVSNENRICMDWHIIEVGVSNVL